MSNTESLRLALDELDKAEAAPIRHRYNWVLPEKLATWEDYQSLRSTQKRSSSCDYLDRNPPRSSDCSCYAFEKHEDEIEIATEIVIVAARELIAKENLS